MEQNKKPNTFLDYLEKASEYATEKFKKVSNQYEVYRVLAGLETKINSLVSTGKGKVEEMTEAGLEEITEIEKALKNLERSLEKGGIMNEKISKKIEEYGTQLQDYQEKGEEIGEIITAYGKVFVDEIKKMVNSK